MPRTSRIVLPNVPHHLTSRGNRQQDVFFSKDDRTQYLIWLAYYSRYHSLDILAYCLMSNHIHLVAIPRTIHSMARTLHITKLRHTQSVNHNKGWNGVLWQGRYFSTAIDEPHLWACVRYVEQNPVRTGLVNRAQDYTWSSAACHCGLRDDPVLTSHRRFSGQLDGWSDVLTQTTDPGIVERIRRRTHTGVPCGDDKFVRRVSKLTKRELKARKRGRPCKSQY